MIPGAIVTGFLTGILGSLFIIVNTYANFIRAKILTTKPQKVLETLLFVFISSSLFYWATVQFGTCETYTEYEDYFITLQCNEPNTLNNLATSFLNTEGNTIQSFTSSSRVNYSYGQIFVFFGCWYFMTITTYGTFVPSGLFLPGIIIGCAFGSIVGKVCEDIGFSSQDEYQAYIVIAGTSMMVGYTRLTYSITVIMLETTNSFDLVIPVMLSTFISHQVGYLISQSLYERAIRGKQIPLLRGTPPFQCKELIAEKLMCKEKIYVLHEVATMQEIKDCLESGHHGFPVINDLNKVVGMVNKNFLIILIENNVFYNVKAEAGSINNRKSARPGEKLNYGNHDLSDEELENSKNDSRMRTSLIKDRSNSAAAFSVAFGTVANPISDNLLHWSKFCTDINSTNRAYEEVQEMVEESINQRIDVRPYMVHHPHVAFTHDSFAKILDIFRLMHLRHLPVISGADGELRGMITRQDLFKYMAL